MELFNQNTIENGFLICNKTEQHKPIIELLYESRKRTGGDDIKELHFDRSLNQYLCIYYKPETCKNVLKHGPVTFHQTVFLPMQIDRTKIILENVDEALEMDTVSLYADYLFQDMIRNGPTLKVERLKSGFVLIDLDCSYDIERLKARHRKRSRLQNKDILLHFVAKTDGSCASFYTQILMKRPIFNSSPDVKLNLIPAVKKQDTPTVCRSLVLIQDSDEETSISSTSSGYSSISTMSQKTSATNNQNSECCSSSSSSSSSPLTLTSSSSNLRTMEMRLRMFEGLVGNLKKVLDMASSSSSSPSSSASNSPRPQSPNQPQQQPQIQPHKQQPRPDQTVETSLTKSSPQPQPQQQHQHQSSAEFAPPIITLNRVTQSSGIMPRTGLVRVRNIVQEMPVSNNSTPQNRPHPFSSIIHQQNRSNPSAALNLRRMILNHANGHSHPHLVAPSAPSPINGGGLSLSMIARFPIIIYQRPVAQNSTTTNSNNNNSCCSSSKCSICLESFKNNQEVRLLSCFHQFHVECIDTWLMEKSTCPTCKFNLALACHSE